MRRLLAAAAIGALAAATSGCHPAALGRGANRHDRAVTVADRLDCPTSQGRLSRVEQSADGRLCRYTGPDGDEVTLSYLSLDGKTPQAALTPIEAEFRTAVPDAVASDDAASLNADGAHANWSDGRTTTSTTTHDGAVATSTTEARDDDDDDSHASHKRSNDHVRIALPGMSIEADNGRAKIRAFGQSIDADDSKGGRAVVHGDWNGMQSSINAHDRGVEMRFGWVGQRSVDLTYIVTGKTPGPTGQRGASYVARGPISGPLVIAVGKSREGQDHDDGDGDDKGAVHDLKRLVDRNVHRS